MYIFLSSWGPPPLTRITEKVVIDRCGAASRTQKSTLCDLYTASSPIKSMTLDNTTNNMSDEGLPVQDHDVIVIGAGLYGIQAARTYLDIHPFADLALFDAAATVGGTWSSERMYEAFQTQTPLRIAEFSDRPMRKIDEKECYYDFFPAHYVTSYLEDYVNDHVYNGRSLRDRFQMQASVEQVYKQENKWHVKIKGDQKIRRAPKLIDASGLTSTPNIPRLEGKERFKGPMIHHKYFGRSDILHNQAHQNIVVLGGAKSAADIAYAAAKAGKTVSWVIRKSGSGPCAFVSAQGPGPYRNSNDSTYTRVMGSLLASIFSTSTWWTRFIYGSRLGHKLLWQVWDGATQGSLALAKFDRTDTKGNGYSSLKPDTPVFWQNDSTGVNQRADFFDVIADKVHVYRKDVDRLEPSSVVLDDGTTLSCDALLLATGWKSTHEHYDENLALDLGLSVSDDVDPTREKQWHQLDAQGELEALERFPVLSHPPPYYNHTPHLTPFRLYKTMMPISDPSIVFLGKTMLGNNFRNAEVQALWAVAAMHGTLKLPSTPEMKLDVARTVGWCRKRYLAKGALGHWFYFDVVPYTDMLLEQLGLSSHRKSWFMDFFGPCIASDLRNVVPEYLRRHHSNQAYQEKAS